MPCACGWLCSGAKSDSRETAEGPWGPPSGAPKGGELLGALRWGPASPRPAHLRSPSHCGVQASTCQLRPRREELGRAAAGGPRARRRGWRGLAVPGSLVTSCSSPPRWLPGGVGVGMGASAHCGRFFLRGSGSEGPAARLWFAQLPLCLQEGDEGSLWSALDSPRVISIHYPDDCVFSLITHYFYAERGFLTKGKTTAITFISLEQLTHTHNILLFVRNSPVYKQPL